MMRGFILDLNKCTGCEACRLACRIENGIEEARGWREVYTFNEARFPRLSLHHLSLACNHCADAPCMNSCPALALSRDSATGAVLLEPQSCIGCRYCGWTCPFDALRYRSAAGVMSKCTFCRHRLAEGLRPACAALCPTGALNYGDLDRAGTDSVPGFPRTDFGPSIRFIARRGAGPLPECTAAPANDAPPAPEPGRAPPRRISLKTEWPLALFTWMAALLVSLAAVSAAAPLALDPFAFLLAGLASLAISSIHLGRKLRAWRAVMNFRASWLSREVLLFLLFLTLAVLRFFFFPMSRILSWTAAAAGFAALYAIDRVYDLTLKGAPTHLHSAGAFLTGVFLAGAFTANPVAVGLAGILKLAFYAGRKLSFVRRGLPVRPLLSLLRLGFPALWLFLPGTEAAIALLSLLAGELIDRLEYYLEMDAPSPRRQITQDLMIAS